MIAVAHSSNSSLPPLPLRRFSVAEYERLISDGFFASDERFALLAGYITEKMSRNPPHDSSLDRSRRRIEKILPPGWLARVQLGLTLPDSVPEPDIAVVRGQESDFDLHHPKARDAHWVVEVAESSLYEDRTLKAEIYARWGVAIYWIINLVDAQIEAHALPSGDVAAPGYRSCIIYKSSDEIPVILDGVRLATLPVADLLPFGHR